MRAALVLFGVLGLGACELVDSTKPEEPVARGSIPIMVPRLDRSVLASGLTVLGTRSAETGLVHLGVIMRAGYDYDPPQQEGLARLCGELLELSARAGQNEARLAALGATPRVEVTRAGLELAIEVAPVDAADGVRVLAALLRVPPPTDLLARARARRHAAIDDAAGAPGPLAAIAMARLFSPWRDRSGALGYGSSTSIDAITPAHVERYFAAAINTRDTALVVAGPIEPMQAESWALAAFAEWPRAQFRVPAGAPQVAPRDRGVLFIPVPGLSQTLLVLGGLRPHSTDSDAPAFDAALAMLRGRITHRLRTDLRLTYGFGPDVATETDAFVLPLRVRAEATGQALAELLRALEPPSADFEHWLAERRQMTRAWWIDVSQDPAVMAAHARDVFLRGLALDALERSLADEAQPVSDSLHAAAAQYLAPSRIGIVVVGDPKTTRAQLGDDVIEWSLE